MLARRSHGIWTILAACSWSFGSWAVFSFGLGTGWSPTAYGQDASTAAEARVAEDLQYLASDELQGRDVGSEGIAQAGEFIAGRFEQLGIDTKIFADSPYQEFTIPGPAVLSAAEHNGLRFTGLEGLPQPTLGVNYTPVSLGNSGEFAGPLVFAGYGITAPELDYDDYAGVDVSGKVVIVLRKEPRQNDPQSKFDGERNSQYAYFSSKELNAAVHRASAIILVNDRLTVAAAGQDLLPAVDAAGSAVTDTRIPTLYCTRSLIDPLLLRTCGKSLDMLETEIDGDLRPRSQILPHIEAAGETRIEQSQTPVRNVIGLLPGRGSLAEQFVVVGAHYDHVGMGGVGSLAPGTIEVHNGADDNGSGTATLLEVARRLAGEPATDQRGILFMAFTAEERGLLGSKYYVRHPRWPLESTVAMVNMDMVGRLEHNSLTVYGTGTAVGFEAMIERFNQTAQFRLDKQPAGFGPSDHASFYEVGIPVLHFFTGLHNDYHRPSDDIEKVNIEGMARIATMVSEAVRELATTETRPQLIQSSAVAVIDRGLNPGAASGGRAPRAILGIQLDAASDLPRVHAISPGGPALNAGLRSGDLIVQIDEQAIQTSNDLRRVLGSKKPGDQVQLQVQRGAENLNVQITLDAG
ncbi:MAG: M20/M25/M40 family metallo-hydrolase [Planctomycetales bacterium]|nr:M20/M25/M40 family metallo-hydrolase [Planctomycetales bacterium]